MVEQRPFKALVDGSSPSRSTTFMQNGKGDKPRPIKDINQYCNNWDEIDWGSKTTKIKSKPVFLKKTDKKPHTTTK